MRGAFTPRTSIIQIEKGRSWATEMHAFLLDIYRKSDHGKGKIVDFKLHSLLFDQMCARAGSEEPKPPPKPEKIKEKPQKRGKQTQNKGRNLLDRLVNHKSAVLVLAQYVEVPLRTIKPKETLGLAKSNRRYLASEQWKELKYMRVYKDLYLPAENKAFLFFKL